jgi:O-antigen/teichoic acid export membrane protein
MSQETQTKSAPPTKGLALNLVFLTGGEMLAKVCTFLAFGHLARTLGPERYGTVEFVLAVMVFLTLVVEFGLGLYGTREIARRGSASVLLSEIVGLRILLAVLAFPGALLIGYLLHKGPEVTQLLSVYGLSLLASPFLLQWLFQAYDQMNLVALASVLRQGIFAGFTLLFFRPGTPVIWLGVIECISVLAVGMFCILLLRRKTQVAFVWPSLKWRTLITRHWQHVLPIGLAELAWASMWYFATVILGFLFMDASLGWFGAAHRVLMALHTFVWMYFINLLPSISRCAEKPLETLHRLMEQSIGFGVATCLYVAFVITVLARTVMQLAYGSEFAGGGKSLAILAWLLPIAMLSGHYRYTLIAYGQSSVLLTCTVVSAVTTVLCGVGLVPKFGATGAATALLVGNLTNLGLAFWGVKRSIAHVPFLRKIFLPLAGITAVSMVLFATRNVPVILGLASAAYIAYVLFSYRQHATRVIAQRFKVAPQESAA